jgi:ABC-type hemin transport system ATPase subunit
MDFIVDPGPVIVGFDFSGDEMLRGEMLTLEQGLTVRYGLNGTGKSRLLRGIRGALLGSRGCDLGGRRLHASSSSSTNTCRSSLIL